MPPKGLEIRLCRSVRPTLPGVSVAPMTATDRGRKKGSSGCCLACLRTSWARPVVRPSVCPGGVAIEEHDCKRCADCSTNRGAQSSRDRGPVARANAHFLRALPALRRKCVRSEDSLGSAARRCLALDLLFPTGPWHSRQQLASAGVRACARGV